MKPGISAGEVSGVASGVGSGGRIGEPPPPWASAAPLPIAKAAAATVRARIERSGDDVIG